MSTSERYPLCIANKNVRIAIPAPQSIEFSFFTTYIITRMFGLQLPEACTIIHTMCTRTGHGARRIIVIYCSKFLRSFQNRLLCAYVFRVAEKTPIFRNNDCWNFSDRNLRRHLEVWSFARVTTNELSWCKRKQVVNKWFYNSNDVIWLHWTLPKTLTMLDQTILIWKFFSYFPHLALQDLKNNSALMGAIGLIKAVFMSRVLVLTHFHYR